MTPEEIKNLVGPKKPTSWKTITVHHSASLQGCAASFDRFHHRRHQEELLYHFVIGNGTDTPSGLIEVSKRWQLQEWGRRPHDIDICIVGNFDHQFVTETQFKTLEYLILLLKKQYCIPFFRIRQHKNVVATGCPGQNFPYYRLLWNMVAGRH